MIQLYLIRCCLCLLSPPPTLHQSHWSILSQTHPAYFCLGGFAYVGSFSQEPLSSITTQLNPHSFCKVWNKCPFSMSSMLTMLLKITIPAQVLAILAWFNFCFLILFYLSPTNIFKLCLFIVFIAVVCYPCDKHHKKFFSFFFYIFKGWFYF